MTTSISSFADELAKIAVSVGIQDLPENWLERTKTRHKARGAALGAGIGGALGGAGSLAMAHSMRGAPKAGKILSVLAPAAAGVLGGGGLGWLKNRRDIRTKGLPLDQTAMDEIRTALRNKATQPTKTAAGLSGMPGVEAAGAAAQDQSVLAPGKMVAHGLQGRLTRPAVAGAANKDIQGPRAYAPRLSKQ